MYLLSLKYNINSMQYRRECQDVCMLVIDILGFSLALQSSGSVKRNNPDWV